MSERNKAVTASYLLLRRENEILLMRRQGSGYYDGWYSVPAGHVDPGELPKPALVREASEELAIDIRSEDLDLVHTMYRTKHDDTGDRVDLFFQTDTWKGNPKNNEPHKCDDVRWFSLEDLPENIMHHTKDAVVMVGKGVVYSEYDLEQIETNPNG